MANEHRGEVEIHADGTVFRLRFTWDSIARMQAEWGKEWSQVAHAALASQDIDTLAHLVAFGSGESVQAVKAASPPLVDTISALNRALELAYYGPDGAPEVDDAPGEATGRAGMMTLFRLLSGRPFGSASTANSSGD